MALQASSIIKYMATTKFELKRFECTECGQLFVYIVPKGAYKIKCCSCDAVLKSWR